LTGYLNLEGPYPAAQLEQDFLAVLKTKEYLTVGIIMVGLSVHIRHDPRGFLPFMKRFFTEARKVSPPNPYLGIVPFAVQYALDHDPDSDDLFEFFVYTASICQEYYKAEYQKAGATKLVGHATAGFLGVYSLYRYRRSQTIQTEWLQQRIDQALQNHELDFFEYLLQSELTIVGIEQREPRVALEVLSLFFSASHAAAATPGPTPADPFAKGLVESIQVFLARLRLAYPDEVEDFLEEQHSSPEFRLAVRVKEPQETMGALIGQRSYFLMLDLLSQSLVLRSRIIQILAQVTECKDEREWLTYAIRETINFIYGDEALRPAK
jgi:hypothetical protein